MSTAVLLGPQRLRPTLAQVCAELDLGGRLAVITGGWEEREAEDRELRDHVRGSTVNLMLWERWREVLASDPVLAAAIEERDHHLAELRELYRSRLAHALAAARELLARPGDTAQLAREREAAIQGVRRLDRRHARLVERVRRRLEDSVGLVRRPQLARQRREIAEQLEEARALAIAGGHVGTLLDLLRLFGGGQLLAGRPVLAWSAGAMALGELVVLFHDHPPQGAGDAEVLGAGLGAFRGILPLPHARRRLRLADPLRVALLARRFAPLACVALDEGARLDWDGTGWTVPQTLPWLREDGRVSPRRGAGGSAR